MLARTLFTRGGAHSVKNSKVGLCYSAHSVLQCEYQNHYDLFSKHFQLPPGRVETYIESNRLRRVACQTIYKTVLYCTQKLGFTKEDLIKVPMLLRANPLMIEQRHLMMQEGGFSKITPQLVAKYRTEVNRSVAALKKVGIIDQETNVKDSFIMHLDPCPEGFMSEFQVSEHAVWISVHREVLQNYLKWRLKVTDHDVQHLFTVHLGVTRKSLRFLCENIKIAEDLGFTPEKMLKYGYILQSYPPYTKTLLEKYAHIAGCDMRRAMRMYPKLMSTSPENVALIYDILKEHNIPDVAIQKRTNIFHISPKTVRSRLEALKQSPEMKVLFHNPNILKLVVHANRAKSRLDSLKTLNLKCTGVTVLGNDARQFEIHVKEGRDFNSVTDIYSLFKGLFDRPVKDFKSHLRKHPFFQQVPLKSIEDTYNYLVNELQYTSEDIFSVIVVLLYPQKEISGARVKLFNYAKERRGIKLNKRDELNLILYFIERDYHFTGNGVWRTSDK